MHVHEIIFESSTCQSIFWSHPLLCASRPSVTVLNLFWYDYFEFLPGQRLSCLNFARVPFVRTKKPSARVCWSSPAPLHFPSLPFPRVLCVFSDAVALCYYCTNHLGALGAAMAFKMLRRRLLLSWASKQRDIFRLSVFVVLSFSVFLRFTLLQCK